MQEPAPSTFESRFAALGEDERYLGRCLDLAIRGRGRVSPNPLVGAVLVRDGCILAEGYHRELGSAHGEIDALQRLPTGETAQGATLYVNLEPCSHHGRTPPCADTLAEVGLSRLVACHLDPNERVAGRGFDLLRAAGVEIDVGRLFEAACELNLPFLVSQIEKRPAVTLKWAMSLDGKIATRTGDSQWISSPAGRDWALAQREEHDAILVGSGTALADDPRLTRRVGTASGSILRLVMDRRLRLEPGSRLFEETGPVVVYTESTDDQRLRALAAVGAEVLQLEAVTPAAVLADLARRDIRSLLVEGGGAIHDAFARAGAFDRVAVCVAPLLIGGERARSALAGEGVAQLVDALRLERLQARPAGADLIVEGLRAGLLDQLREVLALSRSRSTS